MLALNVDVDPNRCRMLGLVGSVALTAGGLTAGALPLAEEPAATSGRAALGLMCAYFGIVLLIAAWWWLGRAVRGTRPLAVRELLITLAVWATPLVLGPPLFSRDVYSYLAQGAMVDAGLDVYTNGPHDLGGPLAAEVAPVWQHTPAPYGPVFLTVASKAAALARIDLPAGVIGMRLVALAGVGLMIVFLPRLARRCGVEPSAALWLGVLNPLVLLHLIAGAHNDALMLGLLCAGLAAALHGWSVRAAVLIALAALVKAPAAIGLLLVADVWSARFAGRARLFRAAVLTGAVAVTTTVAVTALSGTGYGWLGALGTPVSSDNWSLTSGLGRLTGLLLDQLGGGHGALALPAWRWFGLAATAVLVLALWLRRTALGPLYAMALSLLAVFVLGPAARPWYALWGLCLIAVSAPAGRVRNWAAAGSGILALALLPSGSPPDGLQLSLAVCGGVFALVALWWMFFLTPEPGIATTRPRTAS